MAWFSQESQTICTITESKFASFKISQGTDLSYTSMEKNNNERRLSSVMKNVSLN